MNLSDLANLGQIIGALAVVVSLIYVALQIRQNTNAVRSAVAQVVHEHFASWYHLLAADAELSQVAVNGLQDYASLSERNKARFIATFMAFLSYSQNAFLKWREGLLEPPLWMGWELLRTWSLLRVAANSGENAVISSARNFGATSRTTS